MKLNLRFRGAVWLMLYLILALAPLVFMLFGERPMGRDLIREISVASGFVGIGLVALHFVLTARIAAIKAPFGTDVVYYFHHRMAYLTLALWLIHPIILFIRYDWALALLNVITAPWRARWGVGSVVLILLLMGLSIWRERTRIDYTIWRMLHGLLAIAAMAMVMIHAYMVGRYIGTPLKQALWIAYGTLCILVVGYLRIYKPWRMLRRPYQVVEVMPEHGDTWNLVLEPLNHKGLRFEAGQFAWLTAWRSPFAAQEHPFSFSSSSERRDQVAFSIKELGDFTATIGQLQPGQRVYIDGPYGVFSPDRYADAESLVMIAGGVGIAPFVSILRTMIDRNDQRPVVLLYGNRTWEMIAFRDELAEFEAQLNLKVVHVLEQPPADWQGQVGFITQDVLRRYLPDDPLRYRVYLCGPVGMINAVEPALLRLDVPESRIHYERFDFG